jgi:hypothetical protein
MQSLPPLVTSLCCAKDPDVQIGACKCIALSCADTATAAAYVTAGAAATVCSLLKAGPPEFVALSAAAAAAALTGILSGAMQFVEAGGVAALKKAANMGDGVKVPYVCDCRPPLPLCSRLPDVRAQVAALKSLHQCVQLVADAAAQAREAGWLPLTHELLSAAPAGESKRSFL